MSRISRIGAVAALALVLPLLLIGTVIAEPARTDATRPDTLVLPGPSGPHAVGRNTLHLVDRHRHDPWAPGQPRELMVSMYFPAALAAGPTGTYMSAREADRMLRGMHREHQMSARTVSATRTTAHTRAAPAPGRHPLVVLSPGFTVNRATLSVLAEELASRGYVVALVDHAYESYGTEFPGGRLLTCLACDRVEAGGEASYRRVANGRARDVSFVLDRLTGPRPAWPFAAMIDPSRIGMAGHSIGGDSAARAMATDPRIRAGANLDGTFFAPVPPSGLDHRPFLLLGTESLHTPDGEDDSWPRAWQRLDGWKRWLTVSDAGHFSFTDLPVLAGQLGISDPGAPLPGDRSGEITRGYVAAFFDQHLRGIPQPLLARPTPANPEVTFHHP